RIVLMSEGLEEGSELSRTMVTHLDRCLGCMACVTACPSGVRYDELIEDTRSQIERNFDRTPRERLVRRVVFETFTHPRRLSALRPAVAAGRRLGLASAARRRRGGLLSRVPLLRTLLALSPPASSEHPPALTPARGAPRGRVALLQGCVQRAFFGGVNAATARVLAAEGFEVHAPAEPRCCGALQMHAGDDEPGIELLEPDGWEICCGSAGIWNLVNPESAEELGRRKARNLLDTGAEAVAAGNPGCALQIAAHTEALGRALPVLHPVELLDRSIRAGEAA